MNIIKNIQLFSLISNPSIQPPLHLDTCHTFLNNRDFSILKQVSSRFDNQFIMYYNAVKFCDISKNYIKNYKHIVIMNNDDFIQFIRSSDSASRAAPSHLTFDDHFIYPLSANKLHPILTYIGSSHQPAKLPETLSHLIFGELYNYHYLQCQQI